MEEKIRLTPGFFILLFSIDISIEIKKECGDMYERRFEQGKKGFR